MNSKLLNCLRRHLFFILVVLGVGIGLVTGYFLKRVQLSERSVMYIGFPGELFMRLLNMAILPLIMSNIISVTSRLDLKAQGKITLITVVYVIITNIIGSVTGLSFFAVVRPGSSGSNSSNSEGTTRTESNLQIQDMFADLLRNLMPENLFAATMYTSVTRYSEIVKNISTSNGTLSITDYAIGLDKSWGTNILGIVVASIVFGLIAGLDTEKTKCFIEMFEGLAFIMTTFLRGVIWLLPIGVCSLIISSMYTVVSMDEAIASLSWFVLTVCLAVFFHQLVTLQILYLLIVRRNPFNCFIKLGKSWMTAFAACSSVITLPNLFSDCDACGVDYRVSRCVLPITVNSNGDGSVSFICIATLFVANMTGNPFSIEKMISISLIAALNGAAMPAVPSASLVVIIVLLKSFNIPSESAALLFATEFILDRFRTTTNVVSHAYCAAIVNKLCTKELRKLDESLIEMNPIQEIKNSEELKI